MPSTARRGEGDKGRSRLCVGTEQTSAQRQTGPSDGHQTGGSVGFGEKRGGIKKDKEVVRTQSGRQGAQHRERGRHRDTGVRCQRDAGFTGAVP